MQINGKAETCNFESCPRQVRVNIMAETAVWEPTEYKCICPHCGFKIWQAKPQKDMVCTECNQSCAGAPRCKQRGMFAPPLQTP